MATGLHLSVAIPIYNEESALQEQGKNGAGDAEGEDLRPHGQGVFHDWQSPPPIVARTGAMGLMPCPRSAAAGSTPRVQGPFAAGPLRHLLPPRASRGCARRACR